MVGAAFGVLGYGVCFGALEGVVDHAGLEADAECSFAEATFVGRL
jgi:hypothetical protein